MNSIIYLYYIVAVIWDGDPLNDWLTHVGTWEADILYRLGLLLELLFHAAG